MLSVLRLQEVPSPNANAKTRIDRSKEELVERNTDLGEFLLEGHIDDVAQTKFVNCIRRDVPGCSGSMSSCRVYNIGACTPT